MRCFVLIALVLLATSLAARPELRFGAMPSEVGFAEPFTVSIFATREVSEVIESITLGEGMISTMQGARLIDERGLANGRVAERWEMTAHGFEVGPVELPALIVTWSGDGAVSAETHATGQMLSVVTSLTIAEAAAGPHGLRGPFRMKTKVPLWPFVTALAVLVTAWLISLLMKRLRRRVGDEVKPQAPSIPPLEKALEALRALQDSDLVAKGMHREFFYRMTETVKVYFEEEFGIGAPEMTSHELLGALRAAQFPMDLHEEAAQWVSASDLIKYARQPAGHDQCRAAIDLARAIVTGSHQHALVQRRSEEVAA